MSRVFVSNIPEKFTPQDLQLLFQQANIPCSYPEPLKILKSKRHKADDSSTGRFIVLNFDQDVVAYTAIDVINMMVLTVDQKETSIRAALFIPNFRSYLENPLSNLVIYNIPLELATNDLKALFSEFGSVICAMVKKPMNKKDQPATAVGYVLFENKEQADAAMESANGKFLGPNQLYIVKQSDIQQQLVDDMDDMAPEE
ncbi:Polyadenylate-binding_protein [Hexamita inflata]|uniref:Polyadenylate-binding protein n=1 Tax=Hexamita inflata TaxID=28002 RepID=A0AA86Q2T8_9EUKA|nr:Polyadenylate-binding protein [Hexamita inflata]